MPTSRRTRIAALAILTPLVLLAILVVMLVVRGGIGLDAGFSRDIARTTLTDPARIERGRYLALAGNCSSCHTTPNGAYLAGGVAFHTDFGTLYSTNISPDDATGIGRWTADEFLRSMRHGIRANGEHLYPAFPYTAFTRMTDEDLLDLWAYLRSVPPATSDAPDNELRFPFRLRPLLALWKGLYFRPGEYVADASQDDTWNRGAYLVNGLAHCGECHSPRNALGAVDEQKALSGGRYLDRVPGGAIRPWSAPNLTATTTGLGDWTSDHLIDYLGSGRNEFLETFGPMNEVIMNSTRYLTRADLGAMAHYLKSVRPIETATYSPADRSVLGMGRMQYNLHCGTCHLPTGAGDPEMAPRIGAGSLITRTADPASLINVILYGPELADHETPSAWRNPMQEFQYELIDEEIAALATFLRHSWGNGAGPVTADQVAKQR